MFIHFLGLEDSFADFYTNNKNSTLVHVQVLVRISQQISTLFPDLPTSSFAKSCNKIIPENNTNTKLPFLSMCSQSILVLVMWTSFGQGSAVYLFLTPHIFLVSDPYNQSEFDNFIIYCGLPTTWTPGNLLKRFQQEVNWFSQVSKTFWTERF